MYLEGSDQHRGWFHSSLIESSGTRGRAPYDVVLTHGFCLDEKGQKMSKSVGNVTAPQDVIKGAGADILRLWVASSDYSDDLRIGKEILKTFSESYRKMRNTLRWMLGTLAHYDAKLAVADKDMPELERLMLHRLSELDAIVKKAYAEYDYKRVVAVLSQFMNTELSAFYFDIRKDALYCEAPSSLKRRAALTCVEHIFRCVTVWLAPILVFTAEECWLSRYGDTLGESGGKKSVHLELFPEVPAGWKDEALAEKWEKIRRVRSVVTGALEIERAKKTIGSSLEAAPVVHLRDDELATALGGVDLAEICITSEIKVSREPAPADAFVIPEARGIAVVSAKAAGKKCARSWRYTTDVGADPRYPDLSARDAAAVAEIDAMKAAVACNSLACSPPTPAVPKGREAGFIPGAFASPHSHGPGYAAASIPRSTCPRDDMRLCFDCLSNKRTVATAMLEQQFDADTAESDRNPTPLDLCPCRIRLAVGDAGARSAAQMVDDQGLETRARAAALRDLVHGRRLRHQPRHQLFAARRSRAIAVDRLCRRWRRSY